jgi:hypothetical protein
MTPPSNLTIDGAPEPSRDTAQREATLAVSMPVHEQSGRRLGNVAAIHQDPLTGRITGITVRHGLLGSKYVWIPMAELLHVSQGAVVIKLNKAAFVRLQLSSPPPGRSQRVGLTWKR